MPIQFRDRANVDELGFVGYLRFITEESSEGVRGALFVVNGRGEPVDFSFSRVTMQASFLWRAGDAQRHALRALCATLFSACSKELSLLLARVEEVPALLFTEDLEVHVTTARVSAQLAQVHAASEVQEDMGSELHVYWVRSAPPAKSPARELVDALIKRGLFLEPFERASLGIQVAYSVA